MGRFSALVTCQLFRSVPLSNGPLWSPADRALNLGRGAKLGANEPPLSLFWVAENEPASFAQTPNLEMAHEFSEEQVEGTFYL